MLKLIYLHYMLVVSALRHMAITNKPLLSNHKACLGLKTNKQRKQKKNEVSQNG